MKDFNKFIEDIALKLRGELPGEAAQLRMAPSTYQHAIRDGFDPGNGRKAAILILFYPGRKIQTVLIRRQDYEGIHSDQVSFPGGQCDPGDTSMEQTALRETHEELGINPSNIRLIGNLSELYIPPSNFLVTPVIGYLDESPVFNADPVEVKEIIPVDLARLIDNSSITEKKIKNSYMDNIPVPCYFINGHIIWGATAMIISELATLLVRD